MIFSDFLIESLEEGSQAARLSVRRVDCIREISAMLNKTLHMSTRSPYLPSEKLKRIRTPGFISYIINKCHLIGTDTEDASSMIETSKANL